MSIPRFVAIKYISFLIENNENYFQGNVFENLQKIFSNKGVTINKDFKDNYISLMDFYDQIVEIYEKNIPLIKQFIDSTENAVSRKENVSFENYPYRDILKIFYDTYVYLVDLLIEREVKKYSQRSQKVSSILSKLGNISDIVNKYDYFFENINKYTFSIDERVIKIIQMDNSKIICFTFKKIIICNISTGKIQLTINMDNNISTATYSKNGYILVGLEKGNIEAFDFPTGKSIFKINAHTKEIISIHILDENKILTSSKDTTIKLWDLQTREIIRVYKGHTKAISHLEILSDNQFVTTSEDTIRIWNIKGF